MPNASDAAYRFGEQLVDDVLTRRFGKRTPRLSIDDLASIVLPADWLQKYAGRYVARNATAELAVEEGALCLRTRKSVSMIRFVSPDELAVEDPQGNAVLYRHTPASALAPAHLECWIGENSLDYNDGAQDAAGRTKQRGHPMSAHIGFNNGANRLRKSSFGARTVTCISMTFVS